MDSKIDRRAFCNLDTLSNYMNELLPYTFSSTTFEQCSEIVNSYSDLFTQVSPSVVVSTLSGGTLCQVPAGII